MEFQDTVPLGDMPSPQPSPQRQEPAFEPSRSGRTGPQGLAIEFTGSGNEYFRIWIVNLLLTVVTLGFYFPFAKARRLRYFHGNTLVGGHALGFHGDPWKMLRGYALMLVFGAAYAGAGHFSPVAGAVAAVAFALLWPALWYSSLRFRLANTSWRGLRLRFSGSMGGAYAALLPLLLPLAVMVGAGAISQRHEQQHQQHELVSRVVGAGAGSGAIAEAAERLSAPAEGTADSASNDPDEAPGTAPDGAAAAGADAASEPEAVDTTAEDQAAADSKEASDDDKPDPRGTVHPADYVVLAMMPVLLLMAPWLMARLKRYQHGHYQFANETSRMEAKTRSFYGLMLGAFGVSLIPMALIGVALAILVPGLILGGSGTRAAVIGVAILLSVAAYLLMLVLSQSYMLARSQNLIWGSTRSHRLRFSSRLKARSMIGLMLVNLLLTVITFGLYRPFAAIATAKLRLEAVSLEAHGDIDQWTAGTAGRVNDATGDAAGDLFGIDVGL